MSRKMKRYLSNIDDEIQLNHMIYLFFIGSLFWCDILSLVPIRKWYCYFYGTKVLVDWYSLYGIENLPLNPTDEIIYKK